MSTTEELINEIKERGYWEVVLRPVKYPEKLFSFPELRNALETCQVRQRGWYYPHTSDAQRFGSYYNANNYVESGVRWGMFAEIFRFYRSGQFIHYAGMYEDRKEDHPPMSFTWNPDMKRPKPEQTFLESYGSLCRLTEIFLFASRLAQKGIFGKNLNISIKLHNQLHRILGTDSMTGGYLMPNYKSHSEVIDLENITVSKEMLHLKHNQMAINCTEQLLSFFNYFSEHLKKSLKDDQEKFYERILKK